MLLTLGVEILGKELDTEIFKPFASIKELIDFKKDIKAHKGNVPISIKQNSDNIEIQAGL
jgi:hypothetical protein